MKKILNVLLALMLIGLVVGLFGGNNNGETTYPRPTPQKTIRPSLLDKYDICFRHKIIKSGKTLYLLLDFDENTVMTRYKRGSDIHIGTFTGTRDSDWVIPKDSDLPIQAGTLRLKDKKLYYVDSEGTLHDSSGFVQCSIKEPFE